MSMILWRSMTEKHLLGRHKRFFEIHPLLLILPASKLQFSSSSITYINRDQLTTNPEGYSNPSHTLQAPVRSPTYTPHPSTTSPISTNPQNVAPRIHCSAVPHPTPYTLQCTRQNLHILPNIFMHKTRTFRHCVRTCA